MKTRDRRRSPNAHDTATRTSVLQRLFEDRMKKEMLINANQAEECRIAIVEDGILEELYVERSSQESYVGNIYKGKIVNIEPNIQAAFVDFAQIPLFSPPGPPQTPPRHPPQTPPIPLIVPPTAPNPTPNRPGTVARIINWNSKLTKQHNILIVNHRSNHRI